MNPTERYVRKATVVRVIDGDTIVVNISLGFGIYRNNQSLRLIGIDCPEIKGATKKAGLAAKAATVKWLDGVEKITIQTFVTDTDHFGRTLAVVWKPNGTSDLATWLIMTGRGVPVQSSKQTQLP